MPARSKGPAPRGGRPSREEIAAAYGETLPDLIAPGLDVLFCGINPSLYSAAVGFHFARPGNRFWPTLHAAGFTERLLHPAEQGRLIGLGLGITNLVDRATTAADELTTEELASGAGQLESKVRRYRPAFVAVLGVTAYRSAFGRRHATVGRQPDGLAGAGLWVLPNPSGLNAHYQLPDLAHAFGRLRLAVESRGDHRRQQGE